MEPMDLDNNNFYYRSNSVPSPSASPPVSPMDGKRDLSDMEIDSNSPPPLSQYNRGPNTVERSASVMDCVNSSLSDILSLKNVNSNSEPKQDFGSGVNKMYQTSTPSRACYSAPPIASPMPRYGNDKFESAVDGDASQPHRGPVRPNTSMAVSSSLKRKMKTGYGLKCDDDDDDALFSHYPQSNIKELRSRVATVKSNPKSNVPSLKSENLRSRQNRNENTVSTNFSNWILGKSLYLVISACVLILLLLLFTIPKSCENYSSLFQSKVLDVDLKSDLFGQHIASEAIQKYINQYFEQYLPDDSNSHSESQKDWQDKEESRPHCRPVVLSFHGMTGVGKNFASRIISQSFSTVNIHSLIIPLLFPHIGQQEAYAEMIQEWVSTNITQCSVNLIVIDEMDKAFPALQKGLLKTIESLSASCSVSSSPPVIFILISNTHAAEINNIFVNSYKNLPSTQNRLDIKEEFFHSIFDASKSEWYSDFSTSGLVDAFVPFLPLEKLHVIECIKRNLITKQLSTDSEIISQVLKELSFSVLGGDLELSTTGCKRVADKVNYILYNEMK